MVLGWIIGQYTVTTIKLQIIAKEYKKYYTDQVVLGMQFFLLPGVEFRPESRMRETDDYILNQWAAQLHLFY